MATRRCKIGDLEVDATLVRTSEARVELTRHPVEEGAEPSDHARELPENLTIEGLFSSFGMTSTERDQRGEVERGAGGGFAEQQYAKLRRVKSDRKTLTVKTPDRKYENMVLTSLKRTDDSKTGGAVRFSATFEELRFVKNERVRLERQSKPSKNPKKANGKVDQSKQPGDPSSQDRSILKSFTDSLGFTTAGGGVTP